ncbi:MAG: hypothetical protein IKD37_01445 [Clostridia bacterium]|nr:hypothetical protein [Clostridia bacterium]
MKFTKWLIAMLAVSTVFCACQKEPSASTDTTAATTPAQTTAPAPANIDPVKGGKAQCVIVRSGAECQDRPGHPRPNGLRQRELFPRP